jgi:hypothetical protein
MQIDKLKTFLAAGERHLGDLCFHALESAEIERTTLEQLWSSAGLSTTLLPDAPSPEKAIKLAVKDAMAGQKERLIRLAREDEDDITFCVVHEYADGSGNLAYTQEARVSLDRNAKTLSSDAPGHDMVAAIIAAFGRYKTLHTADDVRIAITKALKSFSYVPLRPGGPPYWVPNVFSDKLRALQVAVEKIGHSKFYLLPVHSDRDSSRALSDCAQQSLETELASLQTEMQQFLHEPPERVSTLMKRFESYESLRNRGRLYKDVLSLHVADLELGLTKLTSQLELLLDEKSTSAAGANNSARRDEETHVSSPIGH